jgi:hypothetical protein
MGVRVVHEERDCPGGDYVRVSTSSDPNDETVTLATIERITEKLASSQPSADDSKLHVKTLIMEQPMPADVALGLATCYAERKRISVVYAKLDDSAAN